MSKVKMNLVSSLHFIACATLVTKTFKRDVCRFEVNVKTYDDNDYYLTIFRTQHIMRYEWMLKIKRSDTTQIYILPLSYWNRKRLDNDMVRRYIIYRAKRCFKNGLISRQSASIYVKDKNTNANCIMPAINVHLN